MIEASRLPALVLAGGRGTRLESAVPDLPKPLAPVGGRPFVERVVTGLARRGIRRIVFCTGWGADAIAAHFGDGNPFGLEIAYSREAAPLGTGGALRLAAAGFLDERFLAVNGDSWCPVDLERLTRVHQETGARATVWTVSVGDASRYGTVAVGPEGQVDAFREKDPGRGHGAGRINAGIYLFERAVLDGIPGGRCVSLETEVLPALAGHGLFAAEGEGPFLDIGTPESYGRAEAFFAQAGAA